ncbi:MAG: hypothetical protein LBM96_12105 [Methanobrevibacter sp.]|jgi:hypothetical protein|nr:hypothetical protein [Candidatus Methanoflexus mossambicus]
MSNINSLLEKFLFNKIEKLQTENNMLLRENLLLKKGNNSFKSLLDGNNDRKIWCELLYKIAYPILSNMGEGTLKKNMDLELAPGYSKILMLLIWKLLVV